ncbi:putative serine/threonine protein kinase [Ordospora pajunii]|uniref:putative serine/threonine protein kinase n=1 Tax=Ordospora pajunii TaxID=3039483 RepID=UPI00295265A0|nr:putative serine/threonine protein kinase [Ordospora pajunii]KAH9412238.1 putative serine/threonine protein kinase [Ordospora pajunii]
MARRFDAIGLISQGKNTMLMKAFDSKNHRAVVLKRYLGQANGGDREYCRERDTLEALPPHQNIIGYNGCREDADRCYLILDYFEGKTMQKVVSEMNVCNCPECMCFKARWLVQVLDALKHMHSNHVYHCDIKPENILIAGDEIKVIDFGCSIINAEGVAKGSSVVLLGTPGFGTVEVGDLTYDGDVVLAHMDIWAFGCILYYACTGSVPFVAESMFDTLRNVRSIEVDLGAVPACASRILKRIFTRNVASRYTLEELEKDVRGMAGYDEQHLACKM